MIDEQAREPSAAKMKFLKRVISLFVSPAELMKNIKIYPVALLPFLMSLILGVIVIIYYEMPPPLFQLKWWVVDFAERYLFTEYLREYIVQGSGFGEWIVMTQIVFLRTLMLILLIFIAIPISIVFSTCTALGVFLLCKIMKEQVPYKQLFSLYMHIYVIMTLGTLTKNYLMSVTRSYTDLTTLAAVFTPNGKFNEPDFIFFSSIGVFPVWAAVLSFIGIKIIGDFSAKKAGIITAMQFVAMAAVNASATLI